MLAASVGNPFGQERVLELSASALKKAGHTVTVLSDKVHSTPNGVDEVIAVPGMSSLQPFTPGAQVEAVVDTVEFLLSRLNPDVIHFIDFLDERILVQCARHAPLFLTAHTVAPTCPDSTRQSRKTTYCNRKSGYGCIVGRYQHGCMPFSKTPLHQLYNVRQFVRRRHAYQTRLKKIFAISHFIENLLLKDGWPRHQVELLANPIPFPLGTELTTEKKPQILFCSRLTPLKGCDTLLKALSHLNRPSIPVLICGDGAQKTNLQKMAQELKISSQIQWLGQVPFEKVAELMKESLILVQANRGPEGFGMAVAEAMSWECVPVVSTVPALDELIDGEKTGLVFNKDSAEDLALKIRSLLEQPQKALILGKNARAFIEENFSVQSHLQKTLTAYST